MKIGKVFNSCVGHNHNCLYCIDNDMLQLSIISGTQCEKLEPLEYENSAKSSPPGPLCACPSARSLICHTWQQVHCNMNIADKYYNTGVEVCNGWEVLNASINLEDKICLQSLIVLTSLSGAYRRDACGHTYFRF